MRQITVNRGGVAMLHETASPPPAPDIVALLPLPNLGELTTDQRAGRACVWGGGTLTLATAFPLSETLHDGVHCFPRACGPCTVKRATNALAAHSIGCERCHDRQEWTDCATGYGLLSVQRDALRLTRGTC